MRLHRGNELLHEATPIPFHPTTTSDALISELCLLLTRHHIDIIFWTHIHHCNENTTKLQSGIWESDHTNLLSEYQEYMLLGPRYMVENALDILKACSQ